MIAERKVFGRAFLPAHTLATREDPEGMASRGRHPSRSQERVIPDHEHHDKRDDAQDEKSGGVHCRKRPE